MNLHRIAIPVFNDVCSVDLEKTEKFYFFDLDGFEIVKESMLVFPSEKKSEMPKWLSEQTVNEIITGEIEEAVINSFLQNKISVVMGAPAIEPRNLIEEFIHQMEHQQQHQHGGCGCGSGGCGDESEKNCDDNEESCGCGNGGCH